jgi:hypothetical protein
MASPEPAMPRLFVLDVPEFQPVLAAARRRPDLTVEGPKAGYFCIAAAREIALTREETALPEALWFGAVTGGYDGGALELDAAQLRIVAAPDAAR